MPGTRIVAGLGNPGRSYERTRHNVGFRVVDEVARRLETAHWKSKDESLQAHVAARAVVLVKPQSFMNESGRPLARIAGWWKTPPASVLVVSDDLDLPLGRLRMRAGGGSGGHNGLRSIIEHFGDAFPRLRIGIGRGREETIDRVLSNFGPDEERLLSEVVDTAATGVLRWLESGTSTAVAYVNAWRPAAGEADSTRAS